MIRVLIVEPYKITRECLRSFLQREQDIEVLAEADRLEQAVSSSLQSRPDVVLLDVDLQNYKGMEALQRIMQQPSPPAVVVLALVEDLAMKEEFLEAGAKAYYCWRDPLTELLEAIRSAYAGVIFLSHHASSPLPAQATPVTLP